MDIFINCFHRDLMSNQITSIPSRIGDLKNLKRL